MTRNATQEERWDRERDYRKHDDTPPLPARMDKPLTTAMDIVVLVKRMDNYTEAAALIDAYAAIAAASARVEESRIAADRLNNLKVPNAQA